MDEGGIGCWKSVGIGCGAVVLLGIGLIVVMSLTVVGPLRHASESRRTLDGRFGPQEEYTPSANGAVEEERLDIFLAVRGDMVEACAGLVRAEEEILKIEAYDGRDDVSKLEVMGQALKTGRAAMGIGSLIGELFEARNRSLLEHGMGLGEFTYIYVNAYRDQLQVEGPSEGLFDGPRCNRRVRGALAGMLERQRELAELEAPELVEALDGEIAMMEADELRLPWQDGAPEAVGASFRKDRIALDERYCPTTASMELLLNKGKWLVYETY